MASGGDSRQPGVWQMNKQFRHRRRRRETIEKTYGNLIIGIFGDQVFEN